MTVTLYSKPNCRQCIATKRWLDQNNIEYSIDNIMDDDNLALVKELGYLEAPVVIVRDGDNVDDSWSGFIPDRLNTLLKTVVE